MRHRAPTPTRLGGWVAGALFAVAVSTPLAAGLFRVWVNQDAVQIGYELSAEAERRRQLGALTEKLEVELAAERSPERLVRLARQLGLSAPPPERLFGIRQRPNRVNQSGR